MSIAPPDLDSRTYDQLVAGAKQRIPRYLPEWTDFNESDPGIMLVELFAWMTEAVLYELNQAPTALQLKLLQMLGFDAAPAQSARTELQFTLNPGIANAIVPALTKVQGQGLDGSTVIFETDRAVVAIYPPIYAALAVNGLTSTPFIIPQRPPSVPFTPFPTEVPAGELDALYIAFQYAGAFPNVDLDLAFFLQDAPGDSGSYTCNFGNPPVPPAAWVWEYCDTTGWRAANLLSDGTAALYRSGHVQMSFPTTPVTSAPFLGSGDPNLNQFQHDAESVLDPRSVDQRELRAAAKRRRHHDQHRTRDCRADDHQRSHRRVDRNGEPAIFPRERAGTGIDAGADHRRRPFR